MFNFGTSRKAETGVQAKQLVSDPDRPGSIWSAACEQVLFLFALIFSIFLKKMFSYLPWQVATSPPKEPERDWMEGGGARQEEAGPRVGCLEAG